MDKAKFPMKVCLYDVRFANKVGFCSSVSLSDEILRLCACVSLAKSTSTLDLLSFL